MVRNNKTLIAPKTPGISCLVTGFDPFFERPFNPSEVIAQSMRVGLTIPISKIKLPVKCLILPTASKKCWHVLEPTLRKMMDNKQSCLLVMLGLASSKKNIALERFALNIRDYSIPDNSDRLINNEKIVDLAPEALRTTAPIEATLANLKKKGWPAEISNYAGTFICNEIFFRALHYFQNRSKKSSLPYSIIFIHLPLPKNYGRTLKANRHHRTLPFARGKNNQMTAMCEAVKSVIEFNGQFLLKKMKSKE